MTAEIRITTEHIRMAMSQSNKFCVNGMRRWFDLHGLSFDQFVREGYPLSVAEAIDDKFAQDLAAIAREQAAKEKAQ